MTQNRKRSRSNCEDETEFMPLSKRINNLHINNGMLLNGATPVEWGPGAPFPGEPGVPLPDSPPESVRGAEWSTAVATAASTPYNPSLTEQQNPYYFNINKLLYEMYLLRQQRTGQ